MRLLIEQDNPKAPVTVELVIGDVKVKLDGKFGTYIHCYPRHATGLLLGRVSL